MASATVGPGSELLTAADAANAHDPGAHAATYPRRADRELPFDPAAIPPSLPAMFDTNFYLLGARNKIPPHVRAFVDARACLHCGVALAEISISVGILDPKHPQTPRNRAALLEILAAISLAACKSPSPAAWAEAGVLAGILARTQLGMAKPKTALTPAEICCQTGQRHKLLNDVLLFLTAYESQAVLVSSNVADMDLLLRFRPDAHVLLFR